MRSYIHESVCDEKEETHSARRWGDFVRKLSVGYRLASRYFQWTIKEVCFMYKLDNIF